MRNEAGAESDRIECYLCPRKCALRPGDRGFCFVRENREGQLALTTYGKSTGFCIDPIEKKPLNHFLPGTPVLSFGTAGCNLGCKFCQNWDISKSKEVKRLSAAAEPDAVARAARETGCQSVAYTYNDPVIWAEYAVDVAKECHQLGVKNVAVTAGYISAEARPAFFERMDAANVDLKAFSEEFYHKITYSHLDPVLETLVYLKEETDVWFEITNLLIPDANDQPDELRQLCDWVLNNLGDQVPIHFTAFHPDFRMQDRGRTPAETLRVAQEIAREQGLQYAYVGNIADVARQSTYCHNCAQLVIERRGYVLGVYNLDVNGRCKNCQTTIPGRFLEAPGSWGARRQPVRIQEYQSLTASRADVTAQQLSRPDDVPHADAIVQINHPSVSSTPLHAKDAPVTQSDSPAPSKPTVPSALNLRALTGEQKEAVLAVAAKCFVASVRSRNPESALADLGEIGNTKVMGAFVTVKRDELLRGCCGVLGRPTLLRQALLGSAVKTAREDQRMAAVSPTELPYLNVDVTLMGPFEKITASGRERREAVKIGRHGLMIQRGDRNGLLLPTVATERGWDAEQFLQAVCKKANLPIGSWENSDATVCVFEGYPMGVKPLSEFLGEDDSAALDLPLTAEDLSQYARKAGENIVALCSGGTPSYVLPELPDVTVHSLVLSMQWGGGEDGTQDLRQANSVQVSIRPGVPLQSSLFQMCQRAAALFYQQRFTGQLQVGLTVGFDPSLHGFGHKADLAGVDPTSRGLVISDARHCGLIFHPEKASDDLRDLLRAAMPISSRDAQVHSLQMISTLPHVMSIAVPTPTDAQGTRPPAVAGKFYPAEDAARRAMVGTLFKDEAPEPSDPLAVMVPHAGIKYSGKVAAKVWRSISNLESKPLVVISPKHTPEGVNWSVCPFENWRVSQTTTIAGAPEVARSIAEAVTPVAVDAAAHQHEHGIEVQLPILERVAPAAQVVGMALNGGSWEDIQAAAKEFADCLSKMEELPLLVISSDMNHYAPEDENRRRDRLALDALAHGDPKQLIDVCQANDISMCGLVPAAFVMETLKQLGKSYVVEEVAYATSGEVTGDKSQVVGYAGLLLQPA